MNIKSSLRALLRAAGGTAVAVVAIPLLHALEPIRRIRIAEMHEDRIGHLAGNTDILARKLREDPDAASTVWVFVAHNPANRQLMNMWKRHFRIIEGRVAKNLYLGALPLLKRTRFHATLPAIPIDWDPITFTTNPVLTFTDAEERKGRALLQEMGINKNDWFVCFHARDPVYLGTRKGFGKSVARESYLDSSILNYRLAMEWVVKQGGIVVRMGQGVGAALPDMGPRVIDYATRHRSDFLDIYLPAKCRMFVGNNSGLFWTALVFNRPTALANIAPFPYVGGGGEWLIDIPKLLRRKSDKTLLTIPEIKSLNMLECRADDVKRLRYIFDGSAHTAHGLEWRENTPEEILDLVMDLTDMIESRKPDAEARDAQRMFNAYYEKSAPHTRGGGISPRFALRHRDLIEPAVSETAPENIDPQSSPGTAQT